MAEPLCKHFRTCGGCSSQHIDYPLQLENKKKMLAEAIKLNEIKVFSGKEYHYRNRMDFIFHQGGLGLRKKKQWWKTVDIDECLISNDRLNELFKEVINFFKGIDAFDVKRHTGSFRYAVIRTPGKDSSISFVLNSDSKNLAGAIEKIKEFATKTTANNIIVTYVKPNTDMSVSNDFFVVKGTDTLRETYLGKEFLFPVQGFFQNNSEMAEKMQGHCHELFKKYDTKNACLLDLYSGVGTFGITNAEMFKTVTMVESEKLSVETAGKNIEKNSIKNAKTTLLDAKHLKKVILENPLFVITDPPRSGMDPKTIEQLNNLKPEAIIYISCNITQLGKDILKLKGYSIRSAALFDLFPQTPHVEAIVELSKN